MRELIALIWATLLIGVTSAEDDRLNCPPPAGDMKVDEDRLLRAFPSAREHFWPWPLQVDYRCRIDEEGHFVDCDFTAHEALTPRQKDRLHKFMPRVMAAMTLSIPNQDCAASTVTFSYPENVTLETAPDEPAR